MRAADRDVLLAALRPCRQHLARRRLRDQPLRVRRQQKPIPDRLAGGSPDDTDVAFLCAVALLERQARVVLREALGLRARERHVPASEGAHPVLARNALSQVPASWRFKMRKTDSTHQVAMLIANRARRAR